MMKEPPKISIVTPSFNQGQYIEETILSVIGQNYPNLEYIIIDGGSIDNTVEIIKKYEQHIAYWVSEPDRGQAHAINKGFKKATGDILAWINSDDYYLPGAFKLIASLLSEHEKTIVFGNSVHMYHGTKRVFGSDVSKSFQEINFEICDTIIQPSSFWDRPVLEEVGFLNEDMHYTFDWEWFIRARSSKNIKFMPIDNYLSVYRITGMNKTVTGGEKRKNEIASIYKRCGNQAICKANEYISRNKNVIDKFIFMTQKIRPTMLRALLFKVFFPKVAKFDYKYIQIFINNNR